MAPRGSANSSKQLAHAAVRGSSITFKMVNDENITGFLVGMDDYHWVVVASGTEQVSLVHKASAPVVKISQRNDMADEPDPTQAFIAKVGSGFLDFCRQTYSI
jgi:hypothetical protein